MNSPQLTLGLFPPPEADFAQFLGDGNALAKASLEAWSVGAEPWCIGVWGSAGTGKSHLLQAAIRRAHAEGRSAMYVPLRDLQAHGPALLQGLEQIEALALDDLDVVTTDARWCEALFALYNACQSAGGRWLYATTAPPGALRVLLPDLQSRLSAALVFQLQQLADEEKSGLLRQLAATRGLVLPDSVAAFILRRLPRGTHALTAAVMRLDAASLRDRRALTIPFTREVLELDPGPADDAEGG